MNEKQRKVITDVVELIEFANEVINEEGTASVYSLAWSVKLNNGLIGWMNVELYTKEEDKEYFLADLQANKNDLTEISIEDLTHAPNTD